MKTPRERMLEGLRKSQLAEEAKENLINELTKEVIHNQELEEKE